MKLKIPKYDVENRGLLPPILYKSYPTISKTPADKSDSLKVDIKNQPRERDSDTVAIYVLLFCTGTTEALVKFVTTLHKIILCQDLFTGPQTFRITSNLVVRGAIRVFEKKIQDRGMEANSNYELVMKYLITYFFLTKALQRQKR